MLGLYIVVGMLLTFVLVVAVHELGHYFAARLVGVHSTMFSVGFGKPLWSRTDRHGTVWQVAALPLGGYCRFVGDENAASLKTQSTAHDIEGSLDAAPILSRFFVVIAGPLANIVLSFLLFWIATFFDDAAVSLFEGISRAWGQLFSFLALSIGGLAKTIVGAGDFCRLSGPVGIASISGQALQLGPFVFFQFMAVSSAGLAVMNLFPIPGLDGGHLVSYAMEAVIGRPIGERGKKVLFIIGATLVIYLMIIATISDFIC